jgi:hypothetical protein
MVHWKIEGVGSRFITQACYNGTTGGVPGMWTLQYVDIWDQQNPGEARRAIPDPLRLQGAEERHNRGANKDTLRCLPIYESVFIDPVVYFCFEHTYFPEPGANVQSEPDRLVTEVHLGDDRYIGRRPEGGDCT